MIYVINGSDGEVSEFNTTQQAEEHIEEQINDYCETLSDFKVIDGNELEVEAQVKVILS